jgi:hypothetical protein
VFDPAGIGRAFVQRVASSIQVVLRKKSVGRSAASFSGPVFMMQAAKDLHRLLTAQDAFPVSTRGTDSVRWASSQHGGPSRFREQSRQSSAARFKTEMATAGGF